MKALLIFASVLGSGTFVSEAQAFGAGGIPVICQQIQDAAQRASCVQGQQNIYYQHSYPHIVQQQQEQERQRLASQPLSTYTIESLRPTTKACHEYSPEDKPDHCM